MGLQFERLTHAPQFSLTQIVDDTAYLRREGYVATSKGAVDLESWINAVQLQSTTLIHSSARRADLEAWLAAADLIMGESPAGVPTE